MPRLLLDEVQFHEALIKINDEETNPAIRIGRMAGLAAETGRRLTGVQLLAAMAEFGYSKRAQYMKSTGGGGWSIAKRDMAGANDVF